MRAQQVWVPNVANSAISKPSWEEKLRLISWNVNGIRAGYKKGLVDFLEREEPDVFCVQETKAMKEQLTEAQVNPLDLHSYWSSAERKGYSGTATFTRDEVISYSQGIGIKAYDSEGRFSITEHEEFTLFNIYFPNGGSGKERHDYKQRFLKDLNKHLQERLDNHESLIVVGDYNVAHRDEDVYDPVKLAKDSGFLPEEREWFDSFLAMGFVDTFRQHHPDDRDRFSWWDQRTRARMANRGWRIDYICVSEDLAERVVEADLMEEQEGSDHCPIFIEFEEE